MTRTALLDRRANFKAPSGFRLQQANGEFKYAFDDLGIELESGFAAGAFRGTAEITFWDNAEDGLEWFVGDITLDCHKWNATTKSWDTQQVTLESRHGDNTVSGKLYLALWGALTDGCKDHIEDAVRERL